MTKFNPKAKDKRQLINKIKKLEERLAHANGAFSDITELVTSCIPKRKTNKKLHEIAEVILSRILCSASTIHNKPSWYIHDWEKKLYEQYHNGEIKCCGLERSSIEEAGRLLNEKEINNDPQTPAT
jgi:benzoyl-CoA reductase/2-hydroxyglutaryl-CoA dehydratase subunit BcrC/BadD/HgdB